MSNRPDGASAPKTLEQMLAEAKAKAAAAVAARMGTQRAQAAAGFQGPPVGGAAAPPMSAAAQRLAEMKARLSQRKIPAQSPAQNSYSSRRDEHDDENKARGGLDVGLHPALLADSDAAAGKGGKKNSFGPKFATTKANQKDWRVLRAQREIGLGGVLAGEGENPYYDPSLGKARMSKQLVFNQKGKYIDQANALRRQAALEAMKKRIAETSRKVGIDEDLDIEKAFKVKYSYSPHDRTILTSPQREPPPDIEWWDQGLTTTNSYDDIKTGKLKTRTVDSIITIYVQHPILLEPPMEKNVPPPKPLPLTKKEQAKVRRQRRMADLKEKQAKIRLGLEPAPPPKVKRSNMMRVLGDEAVKDPTAVEARVNREIAQRKVDHLAANEARKLSKEEKEKKRITNNEKDLAKGIFRLVFRIETLASGKHRFKIHKNAEQLQLTGIVITNPKFCLVVVEGGAWAINKYKKLMLNRIDWTDDSGGIGGGDNEGEEGGESATVDLSKNKCHMIWEGEVRTMGFKRFSSKQCPTDRTAKEALARSQMEDFWTQAKNYIKAVEG